MNKAILICSLGTTALALAACGAPPPVSPDEPLKVLVQGNSAAEMRELVIRNGGVVTHDLPIINAVGARISRNGLDSVLESPAVERYLDDLLVSDSPETPSETPSDITEEECDVSGALELEINDASISWMLYNKKDEPAALKRLDFSWPESLGHLTSLKLGNQTLTLPPAAESAANHSVVLKYGEGKPPQFSASTPLQAQFSTSAGTGKDNAVLQRDFDIEAHFIGGCSEALIPAYTNNHQDTYYPTVVGAATLHDHGITGGNVTVAILDSGLWEHEALLKNSKGNNRLLARYDAIANRTDSEVFDESGHGTHMASVLANSEPVKNDQGVTMNSYKGVAPDVNLVIVKAFNVEGQGDFLDIVRGIQFVVDNREAYDIKVLNLSFAARPRWRYWLDPINQAIMQAWASGITVVAAAGNEGPDSMTVGSPGNLPYVITVGAVTDSWTIHTRDDDYIPDFSSRGPTPDAHIKPDIVAPGGHMTGLTRQGSTLTKDYPEYMLSDGQFVMTGSSQASALVSGIAALLLQLEPDLSPDDIKCKLMSSAELAINNDGKLAYSPFEQGSGYVSATRAITLGERGCGNAGLDIQKDMNGTEHFQGPATIDENGNTSLPGLESILATEEAEKGLSDTRKWGVKGHIERSGYIWGTRSAPSDHPMFDWERIYLEEKSRIEAMANEPRN